MQSYYRKIFLSGIIVLGIFFVVGCSSSEPEQKSQDTMTVELKPSETTLYFSGTVSPLQLYSINTPTDGTVVKKYFGYGEDINKGQLILVIKSTQLEQDYQTALTDYLKAKKDYSNNAVKMTGVEYLKKVGMISNNEYIDSLSSSYDLSLTYNAAARKLQGVVAKMGATDLDFGKLSLEDTAAVNKALSQPADTLRIESPEAGIALLPTKGSSGSGDDASAGPLAVGSQVKTGQTLLAIGDTGGATIAIKVNETHINDIRLGQDAIITGDAFPTISLKGKVAHVSQQASSEEGSGSPTFPVKIIVPNITDAQRREIHVGMSVKVALKITGEPSIKIPITAVYNDNGNTLVKVVDPKTDQVNPVPVVTGATLQDTVEIAKGLKAGDKVLVNAAAN